MDKLEPKTKLVAEFILNDNRFEPVSISWPDNVTLMEQYRLVQKMKYELGFEEDRILKQIQEL